MPLSACFVSRGMLDETGFCRTWTIDSIKQINNHWFGLVDCAVEISLENGQTELFAFATNIERERVIS
jgi:hypothetical protein